MRELDLEVQRGEFFSIIGPSGCGKTTTLRMMAGFEDPTAGTIVVGGRDVTGVRAYHRSVNTVFQSYALFPAPRRLGERRLRPAGGQAAQSPRSTRG